MYSQIIRGNCAGFVSIDDSIFRFVTNCPDIDVRNCGFYIPVSAWTGRFFLLN